MKFVWIALAGASLCTPAAGLAQAASAAGKSLQLSKVVLDTESNPIQARIKGGTLCVFPSHTNLTKEKKTQDYERYDGLFSGEMKKRGFTVVSASGDLFSDESKNKGDFLVGATVEPSAIDICSSVKGYKGSLSVNVTWQFYDRASQSVVETFKSSGDATLPAFSNNGLEEMWNMAFTAALKKVVEQGVFDKLVGRPANPPAAGASTAG